jgi:hypothetical protein
MTIPTTHLEINLPRFKDSPAIRWFGHHIPEDGLIDAVDARILWNTSSLYPVKGTIRIHDVAVFYMPKQLLGDNDYIRGWMHDVDRDLRCSHGNVFAEWDEDHIEMLTDIIKDFYHFTFLNDAEAQRAREEFARIRECQWARDPNEPMPPARPWTTEEHQILEVQKAKAQAEAEKQRLEPKAPRKFRTGKDIGKCSDPEENSFAAWAVKDVSGVKRVNVDGASNG